MHIVSTTPKPENSARRHATAAPTNASATTWQAPVSASIVQISAGPVRPTVAVTHALWVPSREPVRRSAMPAPTNAKRTSVLPASAAPRRAAGAPRHAARWRVLWSNPSVPARTKETPRERVGGCPDVRADDHGSHRGRGLGYQPREGRLWEAGA